MSNQPTSALDDPSINDQYDFISDKLDRLLARCRLLEALCRPQGLENAISRVIELDREDLAYTLDELADEVDMLKATIETFYRSIPLGKGA